MVAITTLLFLVGCKKDPQVNPVVIKQPVMAVAVIDTIKPPMIGLEIGNTAPDIALRDSSGNIISLASLKNKIVLIDFWASWCGPCRIENRSLTITYPEYTDTTFKSASGYEILSISADASKQMWLHYLNDEKCSWKYNVRDTSFAFSQLYNVTGIPTNFLVDKNGIIIAKNLRGAMVEDTLKALLKK